MVSRRLIAALGAFQLTRALPHTSRQTTDAPVAPFDWKTLEPTDDLSADNFTPCFEAFLCGRLNVPLDYTRPDGPKAIIAVTMFPAADRVNYMGTILFNPGGPGNEGTLALLGLAPTLAPIVGLGYDIIGFDPRGVGETVPSADCFPLPEWVAFQQEDVISIDSKEELSFALGRASVMGERCAATLGSADAAEAGRFMDSGSVANDMLSIARARGEEKVNYYGFSYGTVLGQFFAAMHPENVGLMVLDGVLDGELWRMAGIESMLKDADAVALKFIELCSIAGPQACALAEAGSAPETVGVRVATVLESLLSRPLPVPVSADVQLLFTYDIARFVIRDGLFMPLAKFPVTAQVLLAAEKGDTAFLAEWFKSVADPVTGLGPWSEPDNAESAITCSDFPDISEWTLDQAVESLRKANDFSAALGSVQSRGPLQCIGWKLRPQNPFTGPLEAPALAGKVLFLSNVLDPVTPLSSAKDVQPRYANSALVIQNTVGHTTLLNPGTCVGQAVGAFFQAGVLPESETVCEPDVLPFGVPVTTADAVVGYRA